MKYQITFYWFGGLYDWRSDTFPQHFLGITEFESDNLDFLSGQERRKI